jgi:hypothetical protein
MATQTVKGGNTEEFYHKEIGDKVLEKAEDNGYNALGTVNKSQMLVDMHPDVASMVWRYGRWHHHVNYLPFKANQLRFKPGVVLPEGNDNYGMRLETNFKE